MTTITDDLRDLGLPKNSAIVFTHLLHLGEAKATAIIKKAGIHRHLVYEALRDLEERKLVKRLERKGVAHFRLLDASGLVRTAERQHDRAVEIARLVQSRAASPETNVHFFEQMEGVDAFTSHVLDVGEPIYIFDASIQFRKLFPEVINLWNDKRARLNVPIKALVPRKALVDELQETPQFSYRITDHKPGSYVFWVFGNYIAHILWSTRNHTEIMMIHNATIAEQHRQFFELMWKQAKTK